MLESPVTYESFRWTRVHLSLFILSELNLLHSSTVIRPFSAKCSGRNPSTFHGHEFFAYSLVVKKTFNRDIVMEKVSDPDCAVT
eukprot:scaffold2281_cov215-Alexandrium_tamarense.AAC.2